jgi:hypothetical protein
MFRIPHLGATLRAFEVSSLLLPGLAAAQDRDTQEVQAYALTDAGLAKYTQATKKLAALSGGSDACGDDDDGSQSLDAMTAKLNAQPGAKAAIASAGMTTREYVVFSWSLMQNGLAAWAVSQPGGKLPAGVSKANVDFYKRNEAALQQLQGAGGDADCDDNRDENPDEE